MKSKVHGHFSLDSSAGSLSNMGLGMQRQINLALVLVILGITPVMGEGVYLKTRDITNSIHPKGFISTRSRILGQGRHRYWKPFKDFFNKSESLYSGNLIFATSLRHETYDSRKKDVEVSSYRKNTGMDHFLKHCEKTSFRKKEYPYVRCFNQIGSDIGFVFKKRREDFETPEFYYELLKLSRNEKDQHHKVDEVDKPKDTVDHYRYFNSIYAFDLESSISVDGNGGSSYFVSEIMHAPNPLSKKGGTVVSKKFNIILTENYVYYTNLFNQLDLRSNWKRGYLTSEKKYELSYNVAQGGTLFIFENEHKVLPLAKDFPLFTEGHPIERKRTSDGFPLKKVKIEYIPYFNKATIDFYTKARDTARTQTKEK